MLCQLQVYSKVNLIHPLFFRSFSHIGHQRVLSLFLKFWGTSILFSIVAVAIFIPTNSARGFPFLHILANTYFLSFFFFNIYLFIYLLFILAALGLSCSNAGSLLRRAGSQLWHADLVPRPGIEPGPPALGAQTSGPLGKSPLVFFFYRSTVDVQCYTSYRCAI